MSVTVNETLGARNVTGIVSGSDPTIHHLDYSSSSGFTYTSTAIEFADGVAKLKNQFASDVTCAAKFSSITSLTYSRDGGLVTPTITGTISIIDNKLDLSTQDAEYKRIAFEAWKNFPPKNVGCVRMRYTPDYTGTPTTVQNFFCAQSYVGSAFNYIWFYHWTDGKIYMNIEDKSSVALATVAGFSWSPTAGTTYELELNWNATGNLYEAYIDGARIITDADSAGTIRPVFDYFNIGTDNSNTNTHFANFKVHDLMIFDAVQNTGATRATGYTVPSSKYLTTDPKITLTDGIETNELTYFCDTKSVTGSDGVRWHILVDGQARYHTGAAWANSDGTYAQSNDDDEIHNARATLLSGTATIKPVAVLHSDAGTTSPVLGSLAIAVA